MDPQTAYRDRFYRNYFKLKNAENSSQPHIDVASRAPYFHRLIEHAFPADRSAAIVDLGCGYGALLLTLRKAGYKNLTGVESSEEQVAYARQMGIEIVPQDLVSFLKSAPDSTYDVAITFDVLEHFSKAEVLEVTDEIFRTVRPGGRLILHVPNAEAIFGSRIRYADFTHEMAYTKDSMRQLLAAAGFATITFYEDTPVIHGLKSMGRFLVWKGFRAMYRLLLAAETGDTGRQAILTQNLMAVAIKR